MGWGRVIIEILLGIIIVICINNSFSEEKEVEVGSLIIGTILMIAEALLIWG